MKLFTSLVGMCLYCAVSWAQFTLIGSQLDGNAPNDNFGYSVAMDATGNTIAVGAPLYDNDFGQVRVYTEFGNVWSQLGQDIEGSEIGNQYGFSLAMSANGRRIAVGGIGAGLNNGGQVRIYQLSGNQWTLLGSPIISEGIGDQMGTSVAMSADGQRVIVGARNNDGNGANAGHIQVFEFSGGGWTQMGADIDGEAIDDEFGLSVSISDDGNIIAASSIRHDGVAGDIGQVRIFQWENNSWLPLGDPIEGSSEGEFLGESLMLSGEGGSIVIGVTGFNHVDGFGAVRVFDWLNNSWTQRGTDILGSSNMEAFGQNVAIDKLAERVVVGTQSADDIALGSGRVNAFAWNGVLGDWVALYDPILGQAQFDHLGFSVAVNDSANRMVIGANLAAGTQGYAVVYEDVNQPVALAPILGEAPITWGWDQATRQLRIQRPQPQRGQTLTLTDLQGRLSFQSQLGLAITQQVKMNLPPGLYIARLSGTEHQPLKIRILP